jgi:anti-sigma regulatory factor (Ser/Thr protein kinase)
MNRPLLDPGSSVAGGDPAVRRIDTGGPSHSSAGWPLPASAAAPHLARELIHRWACPQHHGDSGAALLLVSELVTNAVVHGEGPIELSVRCTGNGTIIAVTDGGPRLPVIPATAPGADALAGRGLWMLVTLADDWGIHTDAHTKTIWFVVTHQSADAALAGETILVAR